MCALTMLGLAACTSVVTDSATGSNTTDNADELVDDPSTSSPRPAEANSIEPVVTEPVDSDIVDSGVVPTTVLESGMVITAADGVARPLHTSCFDTEPIIIPDQFEFLSFSTDDTCNFAMQGPMADQAVIAGEMWGTAPDEPFDESVDFVRDNLAAGAEPDIRILQRLNTGPSGTPLEIYSEEELDGPQRAVIFRHQSERRDGFEAYSAVIEMPKPADGSNYVIFIWAILRGGYDYVVHFIESMTTTLPPGLK